MQNMNQIIEQLIEHRKQLSASVEEMEEEIEHVSATIASLQKRAANAPITPAPLPALRPSPVESMPIAKLRGLTQVQALVTIARHNEGIVRAQEAKRLLIRAGVMRETKNSTNIIHAVILRSEKFDRVRPGEYRLRESASDSESIGFFHAPVQ